jgi:nitroimidazol reductase NimA-like FMN-containing flavoprotein (pyridoxamine 5'-phosphate oxidase superfamily)
MFREMARKKQMLPKEECIVILKKEMRGVLCVQGDDGYPYGLPIDHWYNEEDGKLYFHSGKAGHKIDALRKNDKVSFCVYDQGFRKDGEWALNIRSVIVFGRARIVEEREWVIDITRKLSAKYTADEEYIEEEIRKYGAGTLLILSDTKTIDQPRALRALQEAKRLSGRVIILNPIPESKWKYLKSVQAFSNLCTMISCSTLRDLAAACRKLTVT